MKYNLALVFCVVVMAIGQVLFKQVAVNYNKVGSWFDASVLGVLAIAGTLYVISTALWVWALRDVAISRAYPVFALGFVIVPLLGAWLFGETLSWKFFVGLALIVIGVILTGQR